MVALLKQYIFYCFLRRVSILGPTEFQAFGKSSAVAKKFVSIVTTAMKETGLCLSEADDSSLEYGYSLFYLF